MPHRGTRSSAGARAVSAVGRRTEQVADSVVSVLPEELLGRAHHSPQGELFWSVDDAAKLIRLVQESGGRVHGFDLRRSHPSGGHIELPT
jgi:hypothetical protein